MFERLVEIWLTKANERGGFEIPFCHLLTAEGYRVVHLSRHGPQEQGKDILAIAPDGVPCAFQNKAEPLTLKEWEKIKPQVERLVELQIKHPAIPAGVWHRPYLVTTGYMDETVREEIYDRNRQWRDSGKPELTVITRGDLLTRFLKLQTDFWPTEPADVNLLLEFFLKDGRDSLDKAKLWRLVELELCLTSKPAGRTSMERAVASAAILCTYALSAYTRAGNHVAVMEGWVLYIAGVLGLAEQAHVPEKYWIRHVQLALGAVHSALDGLWEEVKACEVMLEGRDPLAEAAQHEFYRARVTWVLGLVCARALIELHNGRPVPAELPDVLERFRRYLWLWGESAVPLFMSFIWLLRRIKATPEPDRYLGELVDAVSHLNQPTVHPEERRLHRGLHDPYHSVYEILSDLVALEPDDDETFRGSSYTLEALVQLYAKRNWKQQMKLLWPQISRIAFCEFRPEPLHGFYWWTTDAGSLVERYPERTQSWRALVEAAHSVDLERIPALLRDRPEWLLLFVLVYPHRFTLSVAKRLDEWVGGLSRASS